MGIKNILFKYMDINNCFSKSSFEELSCCDYDVFHNVFGMICCGELEDIRMKDLKDGVFFLYRL